VCQKSKAITTNDKWFRIDCWISCETTNPMLLCWGLQMSNFDTYTRILLKCMTLLKPKTCPTKHISSVHTCLLLLNACFMGHHINYFFGLINLKLKSHLWWGLCRHFCRMWCSNLWNMHPCDLAKMLDAIKVVYGGGLIPFLYKISHIKCVWFVYPFSKLVKQSLGCLMIVQKVFIICKSYNESFVLQLKSSNHLILMGNCSRPIFPNSHSYGHYFVWTHQGNSLNACIPCKVI
jgi:hypothetical protein